MKLRPMSLCWRPPCRRPRVAQRPTVLAGLLACLALSAASLLASNARWWSSPSSSVVVERYGVAKASVSVSALASEKATVLAPERRVDHSNVSDHIYTHGEVISPPPEPKPAVLNVSLVGPRAKGQQTSPPPAAKNRTGEAGQRPTGPPSNATEPRPACTPRHRLVFVKTHKTGSSTVTTLLERYGLRRDLNFAAPGRLHFFPETSVFDPERIYLWDRRTADGQGLWPALGGIDFLVNHARYNRPAMDAVVPGATYFTILRHPLAQLPSAFTYFPEFVQEYRYRAVADPLDAFLKGLPGSYARMRAGRKVFLHSGQIYDLGLEPGAIDDPAAVNRTIDALDRELDLVLINEYFDESLVLLKKLLCWEFDDIVYISKGVRKAAASTARRSLGEASRARLLKWNRADLELYRHFNRTLWRRIADYGPSFQADLARFRRLNAAVGGECLRDAEERLSGHKESTYRFPRGTSQLCEDLVRYDDAWVRMIKNRAKAKAAGLGVRVEEASAKKKSPSPYQAQAVRPRVQRAPAPWRPAAKPPLRLAGKAIGPGRPRGRTYGPPKARPKVKQ